MSFDMMHSFSDEFVKIAMDAGARATLAAKMGKSKDYLQGGELPSNGPSEVSFIPKLGEEGNFKEKARDLYLHARAPGHAALKGALPGVFLGNFLTGGRLGGSSWKTRMGLRGFAAVGAGAGLADYYLSGDHKDNQKMIGDRKSKRKATMPEPALAKTANLVSETFTPARQLSQGVQTGSFKEMVHAGGHLRPLKVGQKFNFPGSPAPVQ